MERYNEYKDSGVQWLGEIPSHWEIRSLKYCCSLKGRIGWNGLRSEEFQSSSYAYLVTGQDFIGSEINWSNCYQINQERYEEDPFIQLSNGDMLITKDGTIGKVAKVTNLDKPACLNSGIFVIKQKANYFNQGFLYWMLCSNVLKEFNVYTQTGATIAHLYQNVFENMPCIIPSTSEQEIIAAYLDIETSKFDTAIAQQQKMIDLLNERKQIIINNAVTKGLNPNVKMKDSGVDWIGEIPEEWNAVRIKYLLNEKKERSLTGNEEPLSMSQKHGLIPTKDMDIVPNMASSFVGAKVVNKGDLVFNKLKAHLGVFATSEYEGLVSPDYAVYEDTGLANLKFLEHIFKTPKCIAEFVKLITGVGAGLSRLYTGDLYSIYVPLPPYQEQKDIVDYIEASTRNIKTAISNAEKQISLLQERKQIIINEVVTGKVKVS